MYMIGVLLYYIFDILSWLIIIRGFMILLPNSGGKFYELISNITEPIERPIRTFINRYIDCPIDFSSMIAVIILIILKDIISVII